MRAVLALALLAGYFVLGFGLALGLTGMSIYALSQGDWYAAVWIGVFAFGVGLPMVASVARLLHSVPDAQGVPLTPEQQPELWRHVTELAAIVGTRGPDEIRLVPIANAGVWEGRGKRYMILGLPLLAGMTVGELRAVLAHELGHYAVGRKRLAAAAFRAKLALEKSADLHTTALGAVMFVYAKLYALVVASVSREHEKFADERSVAAAGRDAAQRAIRRTAPLDVAWDDFMGSYFQLAELAERNPPLLAGFRAYLEHPRRVHEMREFELAYADAEPESVFDSHPPTRQRVAAMQLLTGPAAPPDDRPAWTIVSGADNLAQQLLDVRPLADWPEIVRIAGPEFVATQAALLAHASRTSGIGGTLRELFDGLARGELRKLTGETVDRSVSDEDSRRAAVETVTELLAFAVADALVRAGRAELELNWGGVFTLRFPDGALVHPDDLVAPAVRDPAQVEPVRQHLHAMGVDDL